MALLNSSFRYPKPSNGLGSPPRILSTRSHRYILVNAALTGSGRPLGKQRENVSKKTRKQQRETIQKTEVAPRKVVQHHPFWKSRYSISVFLAGIMALGLAMHSLWQRLHNANRPLKHSTEEEGSAILDESMDEMDGAPILFPNMEAKLMSPLLVAAETAARIDETAGLSLDELENLEVAVRTLLTSMDAQLDELKLELQEHALPRDVLDQLDALTTDDVDESELSWMEFELYSQYCSDQERRTFRSLLYNRSVQLKLLEQVERQMMSRGSTEEDESSSRVQRVKDAANTSILFTASGNTVPHPKKRDTGGEDAFFIDNEVMAFGIADGVGGWAGSGVDPAEYSKRIMANCQMFASLRYPAMKIVSQAFQNTEVAGSCTLIVAKFHPFEEKLDVVSVGDCGMRIVRDGQVVQQTEVQEHAWNQPYQLSHPQFNVANSPEDALEYSFHVQRGDVIILGSDGFFDNFWDDEIAETVVAGEYMRRSCDGEHAWQLEADEISQRLLEQAESHSIDEQYESPYAREKQMLGKPKWAGAWLPPARGGKLDDITVAVAVLH